MSQGHRCIRILVRQKDGHRSWPTTRSELESALEGKAVADVDICPNCAADSDWLPDDCLCLLDPGATAKNAGFECDPNPVGGTADLFFYQRNEKEQNDANKT